MQFLQYILDLGPSVMLPLVIIIIGLALGLKPGKAIYSGLSIGIGFVGIGLVIGLMLNELGPAAQIMTENLGLNFEIIDIGWPALAPIAWASNIAIIAIPIAILTNIIMLVFNLTRVIDVDIWNIWHMTLTGSIVYAATNNYYLGILGVIVHSIFVFKFGDWFVEYGKEYFELDGVAILNGPTASFAPFASLIDSIIEKIPVINKININTEKLEQKIGIFGEPIIIGFVFGILIGVFAKYSFQQSLQLAVNVAAVMYLIPKVIKPIMEGLMPISEIAKEKLYTKFKDREFLIGLDSAILLGDSNVISASLLFIPLTVLIAVIMPHNRVLPFGELATMGFFVALVVGIHKGNIFRTIISGSFIIATELYITDKLAKYTTIMAKNAFAVGNVIKDETIIKSIESGGLVSAIENSPIAYLLTNIFKMEDLIGFIVIGVLYALSLFIVWKKYKNYIKKENVEN